MAEQVSGGDDEDADLGGAYGLPQGFALLGGVCRLHGACSSLRCEWAWPGPMEVRTPAGAFVVARATLAEPLYNVKRFGEDVAVPKSSDTEGGPRLMSTTEIAAEHGVSRQTIHTYRRTGGFPQPVEGQGSTRPRFRADEVAAFFSANPKQPGRRRSPRSRQGDASVKTYRLTMRIEAGDELEPARIQQEIYDACDGVPFGFEVVGMAEEPS